MAITFLRSFKSETEWLACEFERAVAAGSSRASQLACEMAVVRLHDSWARCCRNIVLQSACGCRTLSGGLVLPASGVNCETDALGKYFSSFRAGRQPIEPKWHSAKEASDAAQRIDIRNRASVVAALSSAGSPAEAMRKVRNYYAHRTKGTVEKALSTGLFPALTIPSVYNLNNFGPGGETILRSWIRGLRLIADAAMN